MNNQNYFQLCHFVKTNFTGPRCAVVGSGLSLNDVHSLATSIEPTQGDEAVAPAKYYGGEQRKDRVSELASVAVAVEGSSYTNLKEAIALSVLQKVAGEGPRVKWGNDNGALAKAIASASSNPFAAVGLNTCHSDTGLFGFVLSSHADNAGAVSKIVYIRYFYLKTHGNRARK